MPARILRAGQARTLSFVVPSLAPGTYLVQLDSTYYGMVFDEERNDFIVASSKDENTPILATEQVTIRVPSIHSGS
jgi:hypothetical protein